MVKCNLTFGMWVGGEIENGSQCVSFFSEFSFEPVTLQSRDILIGQSRRHVSWAVGLWV